MRCTTIEENNIRGRGGEGEGGEEEEQKEGEGREGEEGMHLRSSVRGELCKIELIYM